MFRKLQKKTIFSKVIQFGAFTILSRALGAFREILQIQLFGISIMSDAFIMAFRVPNSLRKVFAEGALTAAFVPIFIKIIKDGDIQKGNQLMTAAFLFFETIVAVLCIGVWFKPEFVIKIVASGFSDAQIIYASTFVQILFPLIFFISSSALFAGALQAQNHFFMPAFAPILLNLFYIIALLLCLHFNFSVSFLCFGIVLGGVAQLIAYYIVYHWYGFSFALPTRETWSAFISILKKFGNCLFGMSIMELNLIIDGNLASYACDGAPTILYYGMRFMQIPYGVFAVAFSTIMLTYFSRLFLYAPQRVSFFLLEAAKLVLWVTFPATLLIMFVSRPLFSTIIMTKNVSEAHIVQSQYVLIIFMSGLFFFSLNKILTTIFYAYNDTRSPSIIGLYATIANTFGNILSLMVLGDFALYGIACSTVLSAIVTTLFSLYFLKIRYDVKIYGIRFFRFARNYCALVGLLSIIFFCVHQFIFNCLKSSYCYSFLYMKWGYWFIVSPLAAIIALFIWCMRKRNEIKLYFL